MSPLHSAAEELLLLRQLAALREAGLPQAEALALAAAGLPPGPLSTQVGQARARLAQGRSGPTEGLEGLLSDPAPSPARIGAAAEARQCRIEAQEALQQARSALLLGGAGPLLLLTALAWLSTSAAPYLWAAEVDAPLALRLLDPALRYGAPALALLWVGLVGSLGEAIAPGVRALERAAALLDRGDADALPALPPSEQAFVHTREPRVGRQRAAAELAEALQHRGRRQVQLLRAWAPALGALALMVPAFTLVALVASAPVMPLQGLR